MNKEHKHAKEMSLLILESSNDLHKKIIKLNKRIIKMNINICELDMIQPKFIEHILLRDKIITTKNYLEATVEKLNRKELEIKQSVPFKFRFIDFLKRLFK